VVSTDLHPAAAASEVDFDPEDRWLVHPRVAVRPEPFGALLYHFETRRLTFLKDRNLLALVEQLADAPSASAARETAGIPTDQHERYMRALARLAQIKMLVREDAKE